MENLTKREIEILLLALDFYSDIRSGTAGSAETKDLAKKIRTAQK